MTTDNQVNDLLLQMRMAVATAREATEVETLSILGSPRTKALINGTPLENTGQSCALNSLINELMADVETRFGIKPGSLVERKLIRIFNEMTVSALHDWIKGMKNCSSDHAEWQSLVEKLTVQETYFCRDPDLMQMLSDEILPHLISSRKIQKKLSVWSAASSTGEEVYDLSFCALRAIQNAGLARIFNGKFLSESGWHVFVLGTDISTQALRTAKAAIYSDLGMGSFRNMPAKWKSMFEDHQAAPTTAKPLANYLKIREWIRQRTQFERFNLMNTQPPVLGIDLIFCRNVLIYFGDPAKKKVQTMLARALSPGGALVLGASVQMLVPDYFESRLGKGGPWYVRNGNRI